MNSEYDILMVLRYGRILFFPALVLMDIKSWGSVELGGYTKEQQFWYCITSNLFFDERKH